MSNKKKIPGDRFVRNIDAEKTAGIDDMNLYAYIDGGDLEVICELRGAKLLWDIEMQCSVYDEDGDIIASSENDYFCCEGACSVMKVLYADCFVDGFPFKFSIELPRRAKIGKIRIEPKMQS